MKPIFSYDDLEITKVECNSLNIDIKPNKECNDCDVEYTCFTCEAEQVRSKFPNAIYTDNCQWKLSNESEENNNE